MNSFSKYLLISLAGVFLILRVIITVSFQFGNEFMGLTPYNEIFEIILMFLTLICLIFIAKGNIIGPVAYLSLYTIYFGGDITNKLGIISAGETLGMTQSMELMFSIVGIILPIAILLEWLLSKKNSVNHKDKKTDWYYQNEKFDRQYDERADRNNYKNY